MRGRSKGVLVRWGCEKLRGSAFGICNASLWLNRGIYVYAEPLACECNLMGYISTGFQHLYILSKSIWV